MSAVGDNKAKVIPVIPTKDGATPPVVVSTKEGAGAADGAVNGVNGVSAASAVSTSVVEPDTFKLVVKTVSGVKYPLLVHPRLTVAGMRTALQTQVTAGAVVGKFVFGGKILKNEQTLAECKINADSMVIVLVTNPATAATVSAKGASTTTTTKSADGKSTTAPSGAAPSGAAPSGATPPVPPGPPVPPATSSYSVVNDGKARVSSTDLVTGSDYHNVLVQLMALGFDHDKVVRAMQAAYNNPQRAAEYLLDPSTMPAAPHTGHGRPQQPVNKDTSGGAGKTATIVTATATPVTQASGTPASATPATPASATPAAATTPPTGNGVSGGGGGGSGGGNDAKKPSATAAATSATVVAVTSGTKTTEAPVPATSTGAAVSAVSVAAAAAAAASTSGDHKAKFTLSKAEVIAATIALDKSDPQFLRELLNGLKTNPDFLPRMLHTTAAIDPRFTFNPSTSSTHGHHGHVHHGGALNRADREVISRLATTHHVPLPIAAEAYITSGRSEDAAVAMILMNMEAMGAGSGSDGDVGGGGGGGGGNDTDDDDDDVPALHE